MACDLCGKPCQGKYCKHCEMSQARDDAWRENFEEKKDEIDVIECPACERVYVEGGWHVCPEGEHVGEMPEVMIE